MKRVLLILLSLSFLSLNAIAQQLNWAHSTGSPLIETSNAVCTDNSGNVYIAGKFGGVNVDFDPSAGVFQMSSVGSSDGFVAKYTATGQFLWAFRFGGGNRDEVQAITVDQNNNIYITGYFRGSNIDFDPGAGTTNLTSNGDAGGDPGYGGDIVVAKYNAAGQYQWAFNVGGSELYDSGIAIATDAAANVYVGGYFKLSVDFDPSGSTTVLNSNTGPIFLAKYNTAGAFQWAFNLGLANNDNSVFDLKTDAAGNVYATGYFQGTGIDFDPSAATAPLSSNGSFEIFVAKYNTNGQYQFAFSAGQAGADVGRGIALDGTGNIYVLGDFSGTNVDFDPGPGTALLSSNAGSSDVVLAKYSPSGQYLWAFNFGGTPGEFGWKVAIDGSHLFITGGFSGTADFDPSPAVENVTSTGGYDIFIGKYTLNGEYLCSFKVGSPGNDFGYSIISNTPNTFYLTGSFTGTNVDFDPAATTSNLSSAGMDDIFLAKYTWPDNAMPTGTISGDVICVGEQAQLTFNATSGTGPFTIVYNNGVSDITETNVQSGVPFNITPNPVATTVYTLISVKDAQRCAETNFTTATATVTVNACNGGACDSWLRLPSQPSYVNIGDLDVPGNQITVEASFYPTENNNGFGDLVSKHSGPSNVNYLLRAYSAEITTSNGYYIAISNCPVFPQRIYHAAMVYDGATLKFYRNGFLLAQTPATGNLVQNDWQTWIGYFNAQTLNENFLGYINEVRIWNVARSQTQIRDYLNTPLPSPATQTGLLAYYSFNNLYNKQGNPVWNGTIGGSAAISQTIANCSLVIDSCVQNPPPVIPDFTIPDTVCVNEQVTIQNNTQNASSYYWSFCTGNLNAPPTGTNLGNINGASGPVFMDYVQDNNNYYGFVTDHFSGKLFRLDFGNSLLNNPVRVDLGTVGGIVPPHTEGIQVIKNEGQWYALIVGGDPVIDGSRIVKIAFGANITNPTPVGTNWGNIGNLSFPHDLYVFNDNNGNWYGLTVNAINNTMTRFNFTNSFSNTPTAVNLGNVGNLSYPTGIQAIVENGTWYAFVANAQSSTLTRLNFGNSLLNTPTGVNLGNINGVFHGVWDIHIIKYCGELIGYMINSNTSYNDLLKLNFGNSLTNTPTAISFGNLGNMSFPHCLTKIFRVGADLYSFVTNVNNQTITRMRFAGCNNASSPSSTAQNPPPVVYNTPGVYNINLTIDDGLPTQETLCKQVVVKECGRVITGVINDYTEALAFDPCKNTLTVANASAYNPGDTVLIIQMKGAEIDMTNTASFGTITDYKSAGNYEFNYVKSKTGNTIELANVLTRAYDFANGKVQLVRVPYFQDASIAATLTCLPWDGSKGGILVFNVQDTLRLLGNIDVSGKGFYGGINGNNLTNGMNCNQNGYNYPANSPLAARKGESIASVPESIIKGKGAPANGGGGGLDSNTGGGGGGNGGPGGLGGYQYAGCTAPFDVRARQGKNLAYSNAANKIFMGGGGGSGHANNFAGFHPNGGNGGGIVIIQSAYMVNNSFSIKANGATGRVCTPGPPDLCNEGMGGGGGGGTVLLNIGTYVDNVVVTADGGKGGDINDEGLTDKHGPGGGGGGGVVWFNQASTPAAVTSSLNGGINGINITYGNSAWGAESGSTGQSLYNLQIPLGPTPFKANIDSVRIKDSIINCSSFDFKGFGYTNTYPIASWQWYFGDGNFANTQNTSHTYATSGTYTVKLVVTDANGCKDSITTDVTSNALNFDFSFKADVCDPLTVQFNGSGSDTQNPYWAFGDASTLTGVLNPTHTYATENNYTIRYAVSNGVCADTITKTISLAVIPDNIIRTVDTTICLGATKQLLTQPSLSFCWTPTIYLDNPNSANPVTSTPEDITYYYTAEVMGINLLINGDFSQGNTGFTSEYNYATPNVTEGQYFVGANPQAWNASLSACGDHTGNGNMMLINGSPVPDVNVWKQTIPVVPNTNYAFSTWIQALWPPNPAQLRFSINGTDVGTLITASLPTCTWTRFYTTWNSGNNTSAVISIVNKNTAIQGNDFALDDVFFAPVFIKRDSVKINVDTAFVKTIENDAICKGRTIQLTSFGASSYSWTPATGLNDPNIANPVASPSVTTQYIVTGTNANGCTAKDTVDITVNPDPTITKSPNQTICKNSSVQLFASGGTNYVWTPAATLNDPNIADPIASPTGYTKYYVTVTDANTCTNIDSVEIDIHPDPNFTINAPGPICFKDSVKLVAAGGDIYTWQADPSLSNTGVADPVVKPAITTTYIVTITETACNNSATLSTSVTVNPLPNVTADKSNDLDCSNDRSQLSARGATSYLWTPASTLNNPAIGNPVATPTVSTQYIVKGTDLNGCANYDTVVVNFIGINKGEYLVANAFTPNNDGVNDCFGVKYWGVITQIEFSVYNRWGERIFFTNNPNDCWNGMYKGQMQDIGVYVYMIKAKTLCGDTFRKGSFTLAR